MRIYVESVGRKPYWRNHPDNPKPRRRPVMRKKATCAMCAKYPCFRGIENIETNLAQTCHNFIKRTKE